MGKRIAWAFFALVAVPTGIFLSAVLVGVLAAGVHVATGASQNASLEIAKVIGLGLLVAGLTFLFVGDDA